MGRAHRVEYRQAHNGALIVGSRVFLTLRDDGEALVMGAKTFPTPKINTIPGISEAQAVATATARHPQHVLY